LTSDTDPIFILRNYVSCRWHAAYSEMTESLCMAKIEQLPYCNVLYKPHLSLSNMHVYVYYFVYKIHICAIIHISTFRLLSGCHVYYLRNCYYCQTLVNVCEKIINIYIYIYM
jgi:hypothetical protein